MKKPYYPQVPITELNLKSALEFYLSDFRKGTPSEIKKLYEERLKGYPNLTMEDIEFCCEKVSFEAKRLIKNEIRDRDPDPSNITILDYLLRANIPEIKVRFSKAHQLFLEKIRTHFLHALPLLFIILPFISSAQNKYDYPINLKTYKITYDKTIEVIGTKEKLFKRALQFVATQDFSRTVECKTHTKKSQRNTQIVKDPITYQDKEEGKVFGNGFIPFLYRGHDYFFITFTYKIYVQDNSYRYVFTNFIVKEFWDAGSTYDKDGRNAGAYSSNARTKNFPLEEFVDRAAYRKSDEVFRDEIKNLRHQLKLAMMGEL